MRCLIGRTLQLPQSVLPIGELRALEHQIQGGPRSAEPHAHALVLEAGAQDPDGLDANLLQLRYGLVHEAGAKALILRQEVCVFEVAVEGSLAQAAVLGGGRDGGILQKGAQSLLLARRKAL
jgi:hypothetical protein